MNISSSKAFKYCQALCTVYLSLSLQPTLIDNIFLNSLEFETFSGNLISKITDHMPNFIFCQKLNVKSSQGRKSFYRDYNNLNADSYISDLRQVDLVKLINVENNPNAKFNVFQDTLLIIINKHPPPRVSKKMHKMINKPWIITDILKSIFQ